MYSNVKLDLEGIKYITTDDLGRFNLHDGLLLIDEGSVQFDGRNHKEFTKTLLSFFMLHRHWNIDICIFSQAAGAVDKRIRQVSDTCIYCYRSILFGRWITRYYRIPYGIIIPDSKNGNENLGEIIEGYCQPSLLEKIFAGFVWRPKYYKYFDSWERPELPELPEERTYHKPPKLEKGKSRAKKKIVPKVKEKELSA